jgi:hypothetical protein
MLLANDQRDEPWSVFFGFTLNRSPYTSLTNGWFKAFSTHHTA